MDHITLEAVKVLILSLISLLTAFAITPIATKLLIRLKAGKQIRTGAPVFSKLHSHKEGTLNMAGIIIWTTVIGLALSFFVLSLLFDGFWSYLNFVDRKETYLPLAAMMIAAIFGFVDDMFGVLRIGPKGGGLKVRHKLIGYTIIALIGAWWFYFKLGFDVLNIPLLGSFNMGLFYIPFFVFIIVASAFSANETDGLDGLAGGVLLFAYIALTVVAFTLGRYELATFGGVTIGALLAFLWFNIYPARFFMGDTGSMALGITMGVIAMLTNTALLLPLFAPILVLESLSVIIQVTNKKFRGKKIFHSAPIHHHFQAVGWHEANITMRFWIISAIGSAVGLMIFFLNQFLF
ncbi:MAG: phospho-N-acetylmuramoyl-pentapeptide-transferase [Candidatus Harrisonbacteria bacterium CG10_big_fil_rev_8_21_14_0_10_42_17]|uniref:Phospho-N-acetylmuramoyl-pentapeptide-transferase n=1 Tax=Candidatus Harrisonbacteria bacterium CG10_big_fil_rev_8_21_14_0_10_42_17 TaxID=1974584 RepID=A0A2M6WHU7_9BACT|nr:MAG: phospho-N-acetylmuramoyl-pentapeptide-transferase [Candidatus Harrisonbacteria bacterium CG10_big_fil_rev_8_21_14_0_10_42_17]